MIQYRKGMLRVVETWFDEAAQPVAADVLRCVQRSEPTQVGTAAPFYTLLLDMQQEPEKLLAKMNKETRYEIRRAEDKDRIHCRVWTTTDAECRSQFRAFYDKFAAERGLASLNAQKIEKFAGRDELVLSVARSEDGDALVWHSYYRGSDRVRLLHSASYSSSSDKRSRSILGRANRYLHWRDITQFRDDGLQTYDFGGWYDGKDPKRLAINQFKEGFGGRVALNYNCLCGLTHFGTMTLWIYSRLSLKHHG